MMIIIVSMIWMWEKIVRFLVCGGVTGLFGVSLYLALYYIHTALYTECSTVMVWSSAVVWDY